jgi:hypothetical protein
MAVTASWACPTRTLLLSGSVSSEVINPGPDMARKQKMKSHHHPYNLDKQVHDLRSNIETVREGLDWTLTCRRPYGNVISCIDIVTMSLRKTTRIGYLTFIVENMAICGTKMTARPSRWEWGAGTTGAAIARERVKS